MKLETTNAANNLLQEVAEGNEAAFKALFQEWYPRLSGYMYRITESRELTEDIVQDVFMKIWMSRESLENVQNFKNYLFVIGRNRALNELRAIAARARKESELHKSEQLYHSDQDTAYYKTLVDEAVDKLPARQREVWLLVRQQRLSYEAAAQELQLSKDTIKTHLRVASQFITQFLTDKVNIMIAVIIELETISHFCS